MNSSTIFSGFFCLILQAACFAAPQTQPIAAVDYQKDVRPILANHCYACHGFDDKSRQADLRLDLDESALDPKRSNPAITPGAPQSSELMQRIRTQDSEAIMPPPSYNKPLSESQKQILENWIAQGARFETHWSLSPPTPQRLPVSSSIHPHTTNPIDSWIQIELVRNDLTPAPKANLNTLVRRLFLDLIGTLPSPEDLKTIVDDPSPDRIEHLIDALLASPQFGERWGRFWLDQARYADSNGFTIDGARSMWPYRDWVISALNDDMPFDLFTIAQLAGDLLPESSSQEETKRQIIASAFHRNTMINEEGGVKSDQYRHEAIVDRVNTTGSVWLGLTIGCAQCHTHKYDPVSIDDYYKLYAFFNACEDNNSAKPTIDVYEGEVFGLPQSVKDDIKRLRELTQRLISQTNEIKKHEGKAPPTVHWTPVTFDHASGISDSTPLQLTKLDDGSALVPVSLSGNATLKVDFRNPLNPSLNKPITAIRIRTIPHDSLPQQGPGKAGNGNFVLSEIELFANQTKLSFAQAWADHSQPKYPVNHAIDGNPNTGWAINTDASQISRKPDLKMNAPHEAVFALSSPIPIELINLEVFLKHDINKDYLIGRFALDVTSDALPSSSEIPYGEIEKTNTEIANLTEQLPNQGKPAALMVYKDQAHSPATYRLTRGDFLSPDKENGPLSPSIPSVFLAMDTPPMTTRLDLANWLVSSRNPLTSRVIVNRIWMKLFGTGLVETENDFGLQGTPPTHPELLDWLATDFVSSGWSIKRLIKSIVSSATYQQSSDFGTTQALSDPTNRLLARQTRIRLDAEIIRDQALSASGSITLKVGGPSVHPPQPDGVYNFTQNTKAWKEDVGANRFRKTLYTEFFRSAPYPLFTTFDSPDFSTVCTRRSRTNTPLQALTIANDPVFWELAVQLANRVRKESLEYSIAKLDDSTGVSIEQMIDKMFVLCLCRTPSKSEMDRLVEFHRSTQEYYRQNKLDLENLGGLTIQQAADAQVARVLFNTDEFITRD